MDTHVLLWWLADRRLTPNARSVIADPYNAVFVSAATAWEISIKSSLGKLRAPDDLSAQLESNGFSSLPISLAHALVAGALPRLHRDPIDRMLVAQSQLEELTVVTRDFRIAAYGVQVVEA
ncbi:MAG: type II toxin-antitoxin system VapC family toxin [Candidatus Dormiibacterota bacterium]